MHFCPQCHVLMETGEAEGIHFLGCRSCSGIWLGDDAFQAARLRPQFIDSLAIALPAGDRPASSSGMLKSCIECIATTLQPTVDQPGILSCPNCKSVWLPGDQRVALSPPSSPQIAPSVESTDPAFAEVQPVTESQTVPSADENPPEDDSSVTTSPTSRWGSFWQKATALTGGGAATREEESYTEKEAPDDEEEDPILAANELFAAEFDEGHLKREPAQNAVVLTCMDSRIPVWEALGLQLGDAHILRNAGGIVTEDVLRSLVLSHHLMGTDTVLIINHTDCGLLNLDEAGFRKRLIQESNSLAISPAYFYSFTDLERNVQEQMLRIESHPWIPEDVTVRGFVYDVRTGKLMEVEPASDWAAVGG